MKTIKAKPISSKAKNRFSNLMNKNETCIIEQIHDHALFLTSMNNRYSFWVMRHNDTNWVLE